MKRLLCRISLVFLLTLLLTGAARAAGGLDTFADSRSMTPSTFSDAAPSDWFYGGVKSAYDMGIVEGTGGGTFSPGRTVTWSQAVTIAARVRAAYWGEEIPTVPGAWYAPYAAYAEGCGILPENHPEGDAWNTDVIDRQSIAYLFAAVVGDGDCPAVSDLDIPDLDAVSADKREAVRALYAAGIITGKSGGRFDPAGLATRGELATIVTRLLRPAYRVAHDSRFNADMLGQEGNFAHDSGLCHDEAATYLIYRETGEGALQHILRRADGDGRVTALFSTREEKGESLSDLSIRDGQLYFIHRTNYRDYALKRLSLSDGAVKTVCTGGDLEKYVLYGDRIFTLQSEYRGGEFRDTVGEAVNGAIRALTVQKSVDTIHCYGGKLFIAADYGGKLVAWDLASGRAETLLTGVEASVFCGDKLYFALWDNGAYSSQLWQLSLCAPARPVKYGVVPDSALTYYVNLNHDGKDLYYLASGSRDLYRIAPGREAERVLRTHYATVENPVIWKDCFLAGNPGLTVGGNYVGEYPLTTGLKSGGPTANVDEWLGRTALMLHTDYPRRGEAYANDEVLAGGDAIAVRSAYYSGDKLVLDIEYRNPDTFTRSLRDITVTLEAGGAAVAREAVGRNMTDVAPGKSVQLTMVIQGEDLLERNADLTDLKWRAVAAYTAYD